MSVPLPQSDELRAAIRQKGFQVKALAAHLGMGVRTLERRFGEHFRTTPKTWIMWERMNFALPLLAEGLSNKQVAASLGYTCESNFCRDFKRCFGCAPQELARRSERSLPPMSRFDKELSHSDKPSTLPMQSAFEILRGMFTRTSVRESAVLSCSFEPRSKHQLQISAGQPGAELNNAAKPNKERSTSKH